VAVDLDDLEVDSVPTSETYDFEAEEKKTQASREKRKDDKPHAGPPRLDEWQDFFSRILIKGLTDRYIDRLFRDVDENALTPRELSRINLTFEEREQIALPFSELANKIGFTRKHGRVIIASAGAAESALTLSLWYSRVNRIAARYRPITAKVEEGGTNVSTRSYSQNGHGGGTEPAAGIDVQPVWDDFPNTG
jgi:hypothetical protein